MPYCTNCGAALKESAKFCHSCGQQVKQKDQSVRQVDDKTQTRAHPQETEPARPKNRNEMIINLNTTNISRGGKLEGEAILNLVKPEKKGKNVLLEIVAEHMSFELEADGESKRNFQRIYEYRQYLDDEKEYSAGLHVYEISILIPQDLEDWRMKRESVLLKRFGFKPEQYLDNTNYDPRSLSWYMTVIFNKSRLGLATMKKVPLTFTS